MVPYPGAYTEEIVISLTGWPFKLASGQSSSHRGQTNLIHSVTP